MPAHIELRVVLNGVQYDEEEAVNVVQSILERQGVNLVGEVRLAGAAGAAKAAAERVEKKRKKTGTKKTGAKKAAARKKSARRRSE